MDSALIYCFGVLCIFNMIEHTIGCYLLFRKRKEFLMLLLFSTANFAYAAINFGFFVIIITHSPKEVYVIYATLMRIPFYWLMIMLTLERFLVVYLHMRYNNSLFEKHKVKLAMLCWVVYIALTTVAVILYKYYNYGNFYNNLINTKYHLLGHAIVTVIFVSCYGYIYLKIRVMRVTQNNMYERRKWRLFVPFIIVLSFLIFRGITELVTVFCLKELKLYIVFIYNLDFTVNGIAYVFLQPTLRRDFLRIFTRRRVRVSPSSSAPIATARNNDTRSTGSRQSDQQLPPPPACVWEQRRVEIPNDEPDVMDASRHIYVGV